MEGKKFPYTCNRGQQVNLHQGRQLCPTSFSLIVVSLLMTSAFRCALLTPPIAPIRTLYVDTYLRKLTVLPVTVSLCLMALSKTVSLCLIWVSTFFIFISCPLLHILVVLNWRVVEVSFYWLTIFWSRGAGKSFIGDSSSRQPFNAQTHGALLLASFLDEGIALSPVHFSSYI